MSIIAILIAIIVGGLVFSKIHGVTEESLEGTGTTYTDQTLNSDFSDNTGAVPNHWDNYKENNATNAWNASGYITTTVTDNLDKYENGIWYQALTVSSIHDEIKSATLNFKWRLIDNDNLSAIALKVYLYDGTDNTLIWSSDNKENTATWNSQENSVTSVVDAVGTYTVYLRAEIKPDNTEAASKIIAGWDDVGLTVNTYDKSVGEGTATDIGDIGGTIFSIMAILALVGIILLLMWTFTRPGE